MPSTCVWSTTVAGVNVVVLWQSSQMLVDWMCSGFLPVAVAPSWQVTQPMGLELSKL